MHKIFCELVGFKNYIDKYLVMQKKFKKTKKFHIDLLLFFTRADYSGNISFPRKMSIFSIKLYTNNHYLFYQTNFLLGLLIVPIINATESVIYCNIMIYVQLSQKKLINELINKI